MEIRAWATSSPGTPVSKKISEEEGTLGKDDMITMEGSSPEIKYPRRKNENTIQQFHCSFY